MKMDAGYILQIGNYFQQANISQCATKCVKTIRAEPKNCLPSYHIREISLQDISLIKLIVLYAILIVRHLGITQHIDESQIFLILK